MLPFRQWRPLGAVAGGGLAASCAHDVRLQVVMNVSRFARLTRRRDAGRHILGRRRDAVVTVQRRDAVVTVQRRDAVVTCNGGTPSLPFNGGTPSLLCGTPGGTPHALTVAMLWTASHWLRTLRSLTRGDDWSRPSGGVASLCLFCIKMTY